MGIQAKASTLLFCLPGTISGGLKDQQKHGSSNLFLVAVWFNDCIATELHTISSISVFLLSIISYIRAIKDLLEQSSMHGGTIYQLAKISYSP